jgi:N-acetylmuramoyl-L-alanine amidase
MRSTLGYYVGYHYFIDKYGVVTQARIDTEEGAHCVGYNNHPGDSPERTSIGICMAGNFDLNLPTDAQIVSLKRLINQKCVQYTIPKENVIPHRKFSSKTCYGNKLSDSWGSSLVNSVDNKTKIREHLKAIEALL